MELNKCAEHDPLESHVFCQMMTNKAIKIKFNNKNKMI